jgi:hypothetical protein
MIVASLAVLLWAMAAVNHRHGGSGLVLLSAVMLLVGGGFGPPVLGVLAGRRPEQLVRLGGALRLASPERFVYRLFLVVLDMPLAALAGISHDVRSASGSPHPIP